MLAGTGILFWGMNHFFSWKRLRQVYLIIWQHIIIIKRPMGDGYSACRALDRNQGAPHSKNTPNI